MVILFIVEIGRFSFDMIISTLSWLSDCVFPLLSLLQQRIRKQPQSLFIILSLFSGLKGAALFLSDLLYISLKTIPIALYRCVHQSVFWLWVAKRYCASTSNFISLSNGAHKISNISAAPFSWFTIIRRETLFIFSSAKLVRSPFLAFLFLLPLDPGQEKEGRYFSCISHPLILIFE